MNLNEKLLWYLKRYTPEQLDRSQRFKNLKEDIELEQEKLDK